MMVETLGIMKDRNEVPGVEGGVTPSTVDGDDNSQARSAEDFGCNEIVD